jgi:hypothetical protein
MRALYCFRFGIWGLWGFVMAGHNRWIVSRDSASIIASSYFVLVGPFAALRIFTKQSLEQAAVK